MKEQSPNRSLYAEACQKLLKQWQAMASIGILAFVTLLSFLGPILHTHAPEDQALALGATLPFHSETLIEVRYNPERTIADEVTTFEDFSEVYAYDAISEASELRQIGYLEIDGVSFTTRDRFFVLGTDTKGRDLLARIMQGGRVSISVGLLATAVALLIGVSYGLFSGFVGGRVDALMMRIVDILYALPFLIFVILLMVVFEGFQHKLLLVFIAIGAIEWLTMARIARGETLALKEQEFTLSAKATGVRRRDIIIRHLLPNLVGPIIVYATLMAPSIILLESTLSFLGLGIQPPSASWGTLISEGQEKLRVSPWQLIAPSIFFTCTLLSLNVLGDALRDAFDVRIAKD